MPDYIVKPDIDTFLRTANSSAALASLSGTPTSRSISTGTGLTGGGDLSANRTISISSISTSQITGLGGAAVLSVGTTAGTVAAGDDARIVNAASKSLNNTFTAAQTIAASASAAILTAQQTGAGTGASIAAIQTSTGAGSGLTVDVQNTASTAPAVRITNQGTGNSLLVEDSNPDATPFAISSSGRVGVGVTPDASAAISVDSGGIKFGDGTIQTTAGGTPSGPAGGDLTGTYPNPTLATSGVTSGQYGSASSVAQVTVNAKGLLTLASSVPIAITTAQISGLGSAAVLNVGTGTGTVAAGDDSRITGAAQKGSINSFTAAQGVSASSSGTIFAATQTSGSGAAISASQGASATGSGLTVDMNNTGSSAAAVQITNKGTGNSLVIEDATAGSPTFTVSSTGRVGVGTTPDSTAAITVDSGGIKFSDGTTQNTAGVITFSGGTTGLLPSSATKGDVTLAGTLAIANGGTGATTRQNAMDALAGATTSGHYLRGNGTDVVMSAIQAADVPTLNQNTTGTAANVTGIVAIANGGTGQATSTAALNALLPTQTGNNGKVLSTDGANATWTTASGGGTPSGPAGGDLTGTYPNPTLAAVAGLTSGQYGSASSVAQVTINQKGLTTLASSVPIAITTAQVTGLNAAAVGALPLTGGKVTGGTVIEVTDNTNAALRITQLGTGNAILVEDDVNPDNTPFVINSAGQAVIGATTPPFVSSTATRLGVHTAQNISPFDVASWAAGSTNVGINIAKSKGGAIGTNGIVASGDAAQVDFRFDKGVQGDAFIRGAAIIATVDGTPSSTSMPTKLGFLTCPSGSLVAQERLVIDPAGCVLKGSSTALESRTIGGAAYTGQFQSIGSGQAATSFNSYNFSTGTGGSLLTFNKSKSATIGAQAAVVAEDDLGSVSFTGSDGAKFVTSSAIIGDVDAGATVTTDSVPGRLIFKVRQAGEIGTPTDRIVINSTGSTQITGRLGVNTAADATAAIKVDGGGINFNGTGTLTTLAAGGDLTGTLPSPTVAKIQGKAVSSTAPTSGQVLAWNNTTSQWEPSSTATGVSSFSAGTTGFTPTTSTAGAVTLGGTLGIAHGGTGATTAAYARIALEVVGSGGDTMNGPLSIIPTVGSWGLSSTATAGNMKAAQFISNASAAAHCVTIQNNGSGTALFIQNNSSTGNSLHINGNDFVLSNTANAAIGASPDATAALTVHSGGIKFSNGSVQTTAATPTNVQVFTTNGTWTKPAGAVSVNIQLFGAGGGGSSGQKNNNTTIARVGGGGGCGGSYLNVNIRASDLGATESVLIGLGGAGGAGQTTNGGSQIAGTAGGNTTFGSLIALGGVAGQANGTAGTGGLQANPGGSASGTGSTGAAGTPSLATVLAAYGGAGGGGGGGLTATTSTPSAGGAGGRSHALNLAGGTAGAQSNGPANAGAGGAGLSAPANIFAVGSGGGGGGGAKGGGSGGAGGAGGFPAGGGGGGGATEDGATSGAGGAGANGFAIITTYF